MSGPPGFDANQAREFLQSKLEGIAGHTSFYWDSDELEEAVEFVLDAVAELVAANNKKIADDTTQVWNSARFLS